MMNYEIRRHISQLRNEQDKLLNRCLALEVRRKNIREVRQFYIGDPGAKPLFDILAREEYRLLQETSGMVIDIKRTISRLDVLYEELTSSWTGDEEDQNRITIESLTPGGREWDGYHRFVIRLYDTDVDLASHDWLDFE